MSGLTREGFTTGMRMVAGIIDEHPEIPVPVISTYGSFHVAWYLFGEDAPRMMALLEQVLPCDFQAEVRQVDGKDRFFLQGSISGLAVGISALAADVAERLVTGSHVVEDVNWVRLPVAQSIEAGDAA